MKQILLHESSDLSRDGLSLSQTLGQLGFDITSASDPTDILQHLYQATFEALVIDMDTLTGDHQQLLRNLYHRYPQICVVLLQTGFSTDEKITAYHNGADLCFNKPISGVELAAALHSLIRRTQRNRSQTEPETLTLDTHYETLQGPLYVCKLTHAEVFLLTQFQEAPSQVLTYDHLISLLGMAGEPRHCKAALEVRMVRLRHKLSEVCGQTPTLRSVRGQGYQLKVKLRCI